MAIQGIEVGVKVLGSFRMVTTLGSEVLEELLHRQGDRTAREEEEVPQASEKTREVSSLEGQEVPQGLKESQGDVLLLASGSEHQSTNSDDEVG